MQGQGYTHIKLDGVDYVSLEQHQKVLSGGERMTRNMEGSACALGTPSQCLVTIAELAVLLEASSLTDMVLKVERYTGREL